MMNLKPLMTTVCAVAILSGSAAVADVTAQQVWDDWKTMLSMYGDDSLTVGSETAGSGSVALTGLQLSFSDTESNVTASLGDMTFTEQGDGTVAVTMSDSYPIEIVSVDGASASVKMTVTQEGMTMIVSGTPENMTYDVTAARVGISVDELMEAGTNMIDGDIQFFANNLTGQYVVTAGDLRDISYALASDTIDILVDVAEPGGTGNITFSGKLDGMTGQARVAMPNDFDAAKPEDLFVKGFSMEGGYSLGSANYIFDINADGVQTNGSAAVGSGMVAVGMNAGAINYDVDFKDMKVDMTGSQLPFPVSVSLAEYGIGIGMPLAKTDEPADFGLRINLVDLAVNDEIWMLADPSGALPHDPATAQIDLSGQAKLFYDLLDPTQAEAIAAAPVPGELNALKLNSLKLAIAGALVTGEGAFTFNNADLVTFQGMPAPEGQITLDIKGANGLIDKLVGMGLVPEDQAMGARMMIGMFAQTVGEDHLTSMIEVKPSGEVLANGQRIR